jgi:hypothetical protein
VTGPLTAAGYAAHDALLPDGKGRRTRHALRWRRKELARMKKKFGVEDLVDAR